jgi:UDP-3-O-[3-hydroxymyristoyl] glucosamine N-acyltransferase
VPPTFRLGKLADELGLDVEGDPGIEIRGVAGLENAGASDLSFVRSEAFASAVMESAAAAVIAPPGLDIGARAALRSAHPGLDFSRAIRILAPEARPAPGVDPGARVDENASVDPTATVGPGCVVGPGARIGARSILGASVTVYPDVIIGEECAIHAGCSLAAVEIGDRVLLHPGVVLGADGFGYVADEQGVLSKVPQVGRVVIEDDVEIGANTTIDRGSLGETRIGRNTKIDNLVQIAHNCVIGEGVLIAAQVGLAGSTRVEQGAILMGQVGVAGHLTIGERAFVGAKCGVSKDVPAGARVWGTPHREERTWHRISAALPRLPDLMRRVRVLERRLGISRGADEPESDSAPE